MTNTSTSTSIYAATNSLNCQCIMLTIIYNSIQCVSNKVNTTKIYNCIVVNRLPNHKLDSNITM